MKTTIEELIAEKISNHHSTWNTVLDNTQPQNYICNHWKVEIKPGEIMTNTDDGTFIVNDGYLSSIITLGKGDNLQPVFYNKCFIAKGKFEFKNSGQLRIMDIDINIEIDIF